MERKIEGDEEYLVTARAEFIKLGFTCSGIRDGYFIIYDWKD
jgi:hypothetical protein